MNADLLEGIAVEPEPLYSEIHCMDGVKRTVGRIRCGPAVVRYIGEHDRGGLVDEPIDFADVGYVKNSEGVVCNELLSEEKWNVNWIICRPENFEKWTGSEVISVMYAPEINMAWVLKSESYDPKWEYYTTRGWDKVDTREMADLEFHEFSDPIIREELEGTPYEPDLVAQSV